MILHTESQLGKKSRKYHKNRRYFNEILENVDISTKNTACRSRMNELGNSEKINKKSRFIVDIINLSMIFCLFFLKNRLCFDLLPCSLTA